jgi:cellulose biosynthesis protein BcsQ
MGTIISVVNNKGGVGKTTITTNLAHAISNLKKNVLVVDIDSQCNSSSFFFHGDPDRVPTPNLYEFLEDEKVDVRECIYNAADYSRIAILPTHESQAALEPELIQRADTGIGILRNRMRDYAKANYDITLIDCPPNLGTFVMMAMVASDFVIVPLESGSKYSIDGIAKTVKLIDEIRQEQQNPDLALLRFLLNKAKPRTIVTRSMHEMLTEKYPGRVFKTILPDSTDMKQGEFLSETVLRQKPNSYLTRQFRELAKEVLSLEELRSQVSPVDASDEDQVEVDAVLEDHDDEN